MATVATTAHALVGEDGILLDTGVLRRVAKGYTARLIAMLRAPSGESIEVMLAYQEGDGRLIPLFGTAIKSGNPSWKKVLGTKVDITQYVARFEPMVLRPTAKVSGGTGEIVLPTVVVESE